MGVAISVSNLGTTFFTKLGEVRAVDDVSFSIEEGQILGLVGESGSGKTVTGFSILGLVDPPGRVVGGSIKFMGTELVGLAEEEMRRLRGRRIAMVFQDPMMTLNPVLRIDTQIIEAILACRNKTRSQRRRLPLARVAFCAPVRPQTRLSRPRPTCHRCR
jgi:peptide/nickel transport system ATP-binding protein